MRLSGAGRRDEHMRFYFDVCGGAIISTDDHGCDCADRDAACRLALQALVDIAADEIMRAEPLVFTILVRDEAGRPILSTLLKIELSWLA